jgi:hypothetical protein
VAVDDDAVGERGTAISRTWSGVTNSSPSIKASAWVRRCKAIDARGLAPSLIDLRRRVPATMSTM